MRLEISLLLFLESHKENIMPFSIVLETEDGGQLERIEDLSNLLHRVLPSNDDSSYQYLQFIDWYGDTVFNGLQMKPFKAEWKRLKKVAQTDEEKVILARVNILADRCQTEPHLYLKFYGD
jgi:hypothetical protein